MKSVLKYNPNDTASTLTLPVLWSVLEPELGVICSNLPLFPPLFSKYISPWASKYIPSRFLRSDGWRSSALDDANKDHFGSFWASNNECKVATGNGEEEVELSRYSPWRDGDREAGNDSASSQVGIAGVTVTPPPRIMVKKEFHVDTQG